MCGDNPCEIPNFLRAVPKSDENAPPEKEKRAGFRPDGDYDRRD
jgi:hypothetical protein